MKTIKSILIDAAFILLLMFYAFSSIAVALLPVVPYLITSNDSWMCLMILSFPIGMAMFIKSWPYLTNNDGFFRWAEQYGAFKN